MGNAVLKSLGQRLEKVQFANGFVALEVDAKQVGQLKQTDVDVGCFAAADATEAAFLSVAVTPKGLVVGSVFPLTAKLPADVKPEVLVRLMQLGGSLADGSALVLDQHRRVCWQRFRTFDTAQAGAAVEFITDAIHAKKAAGEAMTATFRELGLSTDLSRELDLQVAAGAPVKLSPRQMEAIAGGSLLGCFGAAIVGICSIAAGVATCGAALGGAAIEVGMAAGCLAV